MCAIMAQVSQVAYSVARPRPYALCIRLRRRRDDRVLAVAAFSDQWRVRQVLRRTEADTRTQIRSLHTSTKRRQLHDRQARARSSFATPRCDHNVINPRDLLVIKIAFRPILARSRLRSASWSRPPSRSWTALERAAPPCLRS